jgi:hypothetical protein
MLLAGYSQLMLMLLNPKPLTSEIANEAKAEQPKVVDARVAKFKEYNHLLIESRTLR